MRPIDGDAIEAFLRDEYHGAISDSELKVYQVINLIGNAPTIDMVKHGEWIQTGNFDDDNNVYECSICDEPWQLTAGTPTENNMNFCPKCGSNMREEPEK